jgi:hypothetical protein
VFIPNTVVTFVMSDAAKWVNGQVIRVNGGFAYSYRNVVTVYSFLDTAVITTTRLSMIFLTIVRTVPPHLRRL